MEAQARSATDQAVVLRSQSTCPTCATYELSLCQAVTEAAWSLPPAAAAKLQPTVHTAAARRIICREQELQDLFPVICEGWAASVVMLSDSSRQILSFLLPGDVVSAALLFDAPPHCSLEAITEVRYRSYKRAVLKGYLSKYPELFDRLSKACIEEKVRADQLIVDLGRRTAEERIARLILGLADRLSRRGMMQADATEMDFPLRQHHIADATGLTPVHVNKLLSEFRRRGLIKISDRTLTILDPAGFRRVAHMR